MFLRSQPFVGKFTQCCSTMKDASYRNAWYLLDTVSKYKDEALVMWLNRPVNRDSKENSELEDSHFSDDNSQYLLLKHLVKNNIEYFKNAVDKEGIEIHLELLVLSDNLEKGLSSAAQIARFVDNFDFSSEVKGNGYRTFLDIFFKCIIKCNELCSKISNRKDPVNKFDVKDLQAWSETMASLATVLEILSDSQHSQYQLFIRKSAMEIWNNLDDINQSCFYGQCLGFHYPSEMRNILKGLAIYMATLSDACEQSNVITKAIRALFSGGRYFMDEKMRGRNLVTATQDCSLEFFKSYYSASDQGLLRKFPHLLCPQMAVHMVISIPPNYLEMKTTSGELTIVSPPINQIGLASLSCTIISSRLYEGMDDGNGFYKSDDYQPPSRNLIIHIHGGGFMMSSANLSQLFLRQWAADTGFPIFSIDHSLSPEAKFPRQVDEVFFAYCWALSNAHQLGTTAENVVLAGDSTGGTLALALTIKCIQRGVKIPTGILALYTPVLIDFIPSPSRMLSLMDPIIPFGCFVKCLTAYAGGDIPNYKPKNMEEEGSFDGFLDKDETCMDLSASIIRQYSILSPLQERMTEFDSSFDEDSSIKENLVEIKLSSQNSSVSEYSMNNDEEFTELKKLKTSAQNFSASEASLVDDVFMQQFPFERCSICAQTGSAYEISVDNDETDTNVSCDLEQCPHTAVAKQDPLLSPLFADKDILSKFPPVSFITSTLDPTLDDCIEFAKKLRAAGGTVTLDILRDLPHGFLMLIHAIKSCRDGSDVCVQRIIELLAE